MVLAYVGDILILGKDIQEVQAVKRDIGSKFPVTDCGEPTHFLGVDI